MKRLRDNDLRVGLVSSKYYRSKVIGKRRRVRPSKRSRMPLLRAGIAPELKNLDTLISFNVDQTIEVPSTGQLTLIPQGDDGTERDGRQVVIKSIQLRLNAAYTPATAAVGAVPATLAGVWLVLDTQPNGAAATATDVITTSGTTFVASWVKNLANDARFKILKFFEFIFPTTGDWVSAAGNVRLGYAPIQEYYTKCEIPVQFSGSTGVISAISTNNLFLIAVAENSDDVISIGGKCRLRFVG